MHTYDRSEYKQWKMTGEEVTKDWYKDEYRTQSLMHRLGGANRRTDVEITISGRGRTQELSGTIICADLGHPTIRFEDGKHGFISFSSDVGKLLFIKGWNQKHVPRYKWPIEELEVKAYHFETPICPVCDERLEYGMANWDPHDPDGFTSGWLCPECFPKRFERGIK